MATMETYRHPPESPYSFPHSHPQQPHLRHPPPSHPQSYPHHHHQRHPSSDLSSHHLPYLPPPPPHNGARDGASPRSREEVTKHGHTENTPPSPVESQLPYSQAQVHHHHYHDHHQQSNRRESPRDFGRVEITPSSPLQSHPSHHISRPHSRLRDEISSPPLPLPHQYAHAPLEERALRQTHAERPQYPQHPQHPQHSLTTQQQHRSKGPQSEQRGAEQHHPRPSNVHPHEQRTPMQSTPPPPPPSLAPRPQNQPLVVPQPQPQQLPVRVQHQEKQQQERQQQQQQRQEQQQQQEQQQKPRTREQLEQELIQHEKEQKERWQQRKKSQAAQAAEKQRALDEKLRRQEEYLQWDLQRQKQLHQAKTKQLKEEEKQRKAAREQELARQRTHSSGRLMDTELPSAATPPTATAPYHSQPPQPRLSPGVTVSSPHHPHYQHFQGPIAEIEPSLKRPREVEGPRPPSMYPQPPHRLQGQHCPPSPRENQPWPRSVSPLLRKGSTVSLSKLSLEEEGGFRLRHQSAASWSEPSSSGLREARMAMEDQHSGYCQPYPPHPTQSPHHLSFHHQAQPSPKPRSLPRPQPHSPMDIASPPPPPHMQQDVKRVKTGERAREYWEAAATAPSTPVVATRPAVKRPLSYEYYGSSSLQRSPLLGSRRAAATVTRSSSFPAHAPAPPAVFSSRPHSPVGLPPALPVPTRPLAPPTHSRHFPSPQTPETSRPSYPGSNGNNSNSFQPRSQSKEDWNTTQPMTARDRMSQPPGLVAHGLGQQGHDRVDQEKWNHEQRAPELRPPSEEPVVIRGGGGVGSQRPTTSFPGSSSEAGFHLAHQNQQQQQPYYHHHPSPRQEQHLDYSLTHREHPQQQQQYRHGYPSPYPLHQGHF